MITDNLSGVVCGNSDILLDQLIQKGVHFFFTDRSALQH